MKVQFFCKAISKFEGAEKDQKVHPVGGEIRYSCPEGHILAGTDVRFCQTDGRWSGKAPECKFHDCGKIPGELDSSTKDSDNLSQRLDVDM